jgi:diacylglycerol kinase family enzyme
LNEIIIAAKALAALRSVRIAIDGRRRSYHSLIFSNVSTMSKVLKISSDASNTDGLFEFTAFKRRHKFKLLVTLLRASTTGLSDAQPLKEFSFRSVKQILVQLDGEIYTIDANSNVKIKIAPKALECIV